MAMTNEQLTKWIDEIFGTIDEIKQNSGDISGLTRSVRQLREDLTATQADVTDLEDQTAGTVSLAKAPLQYFTDGSATQALDLVADIIPKQAGTGDPSPTNVRAITGYSSVTASAAAGNILDPSRITYSANNVNAYVFSDENGFYVKQGEKFVFSASEECNGIYVSEAVDGATSFAQVNNASVLAFTAPHDMYIKLQVWRNGGTNTLNYQLERGEEATPYKAYDPSTATISLGSTVYGGTVNFTSGELVVTHAGIDMGSLEWSKFTDGIFTKGLPDGKTGINTINEVISSSYQLTISPEKSSNPSLLENGEMVKNGSNTGLIVRDNRYTDASAFITGVTGQKLVYELATPVTTTLTPAQLSLLQGENNVSATSGPITLTYAPDNVLAEVYAYIQKRFDTLTASLAANRTTRKTTKTLTKKED